MTSALLRRRGFALHAADGLAEIELEAFPLNRLIRATLVKDRSPQNHRHYFACLTAFSKATDIASKETLHEMLKLKCGLVKPITTRSGEMILVPDSVAFDRLDEAAFRDFKKRALDALRINFGIDPVTLEAEGDALLGKPA